MSTVTRSKLLPPFLLIAAICILFWPALVHPFYILHPTFSPFSDTMVIHWPKAHLIVQSWQAGEGLPYWTPLILSGMPLAANQLAMLFYPPTWLFLFLPIELTFNLLFIFHLLLGGFGIYLLLREGFGLSPAAALFGGLTFALNGKLLAHAAGGHVSMVGAIGWLPWGLYGLHRLLQENRSYKFTLAQIRWSILVAVVLAVQIVTHTLLLIYCVYLIGAAVAWHFFHLLWGNGWNQVRLEIKRLFFPLLLVPILAGLLGAGQLLSLLELVEFSNRSLSLAEAARYSVTSTQLFVGLLLPSAQGGHEFVIYLGLIPLLLVPFGVTRRNHWTWFYSGLLVFTLLFALGPSTPIHGLFYEFAPGFGWVRTPARIFFVGALATALLVGFAVDRLASVEWSLTAQKGLTRAAIAIGALAAMFGLGLAFGFNQASRATYALAIVIPIGVSLILLRVKGILSAQMATSLLGMILFLDLASFDISMMRFVSLEEALAPGKAAAEYLAQKSGAFRVYSPSYSLPVQTAAAHKLSLADGVEPVHLASYDQFMALAGGYNDPSFSVTIPNFGDEPLETALKDTEPNLKLLGLLNVEYLVSAFPMDWPGLNLEVEIEGTYIYANQKALPRAWVVHQTLPTDVNWLEQLNTLPDLVNVATIESGPQLSNSTRRHASVAMITHYSADLIEIETEISEPGWLVVSEVWYPGWQASVNGSLQPVEKVNGLLRGIYLDRPGSKQITMEYRPKGVIWGNPIAGVTTGLMVLAGLWLWLDKKSFGIHIIFILISIWFIGQVLYPSSRNLTHGFGAYYSAARMLRTDRISDSVYDPVYFRAVVREDSHQQVDDIFNANPPTASFMFWPLSFFSIEVGRVIWTVANALMLWGGLALLVWAFSDQPIRATYLALFSLGMLFQPVIQNIRLGQAYLLIFLLQAIATVSFEKREARWGGVSLAMALLLKTAGWAILPLLGWQRRWQYLAWTLGITGTILLLTLPLFPLSVWQAYLQLLAGANQSPQVCVIAYQTTRSLLCHTLVFHETWNPSPIIHLPWLASGLYLVLALITLILSFHLARQNQTAAFISIIAWGIIFGPLGEQYHHSVMLIPIVWLILYWQAGKLSSRIGKWGIVIATLLYISPFHIGHPQFQDGWRAFLAYPRVYSAWLILLVIYSQSLQHLYARLLHR